MIQVGSVVQYFTSRTFENGVRLKTPEPIGPLAAMVVDVVEPDRVSLVVWMPQGRMYPAFNVTTSPTTPVRHYWRRVPSTAEGMEAVEMRLAEAAQEQDALQKQLTVLRAQHDALETAVKELVGLCTKMAKAVKPISDPIDKMIDEVLPKEESDV